MTGKDAHKEGVIADMQQRLLDKGAEIAGLRRDNAILKDMLMERAAEHERDLVGYERSFLDASLSHHLRAWWRKIW